MKYSVGHEDQYKVSASFKRDFFYSPDTYIHPTAHVDADVELDQGVKIGPYAIITGNVSIGAHAQINAHSIIGSPAQVRTIKAPLGRVEIGAHTIIKEFVTISSPSKADGLTHIGSHCYLMHFSHIAHDVYLEDHVELTNNALIGGHAHIESYALLMAHSVVHQNCRIGGYSALAPFSGCRQDIPPFGLFTQQPAAFTGLNRIKLKRALFSAETIGLLKSVTKLFYQDKLPLEIIQQQCKDAGWDLDAQVARFLSFIERSPRGVSRQSIIDEKAL